MYPAHFLISGAQNARCSLDSQLRHKSRFIQECVPADVKLILIGNNYTKLL